MTKTKTHLVFTKTKELKSSTINISIIDKNCNHYLQTSPYLKKEEKSMFQNLLQIYIYV